MGETNREEPLVMPHHILRKLQQCCNATWSVEFICLWRIKYTVFIHNSVMKLPVMIILVFKEKLLLEGYIFWNVWVWKYTDGFIDCPFFVCTLLLFLCYQVAVKNNDRLLQSCVALKYFYFSSICACYCSIYKC